MGLSAQLRPSAVAAASAAWLRSYAVAATSAAASASGFGVTADPQEARCR